MLIFEEDACDLIGFDNIDFSDDDRVITPDQKKELDICLSRARGMQKNIVPQGDGVKLKKACDQYELILSRIKFESGM